MSPLDRRVESLRGISARTLRGLYRRHANRMCECETVADCDATRGVLGVLLADLAGAL